MKQLTINIPDSHVSEFIEYFSHIPEATIVNETDFVITPHLLDILDKSHNTSSSKYITKMESNRMLKEKYGF